MLPLKPVQDYPAWKESRDEKVASVCSDCFSSRQAGSYYVTTYAGDLVGQLFVASPLLSVIPKPIEFPVRVADGAQGSKADDEINVNAFFGYQSVIISNVISWLSL